MSSARSAADECVLLVDVVVTLGMATLAWLLRPAGAVAAFGIATRVSTPAVAHRAEVGVMPVAIQQVRDATSHTLDMQPRYGFGV
jgi:hypothetical protein